MDFFTRLKDIINSELNAALDKAEDPEKMLALTLKEMEDALIDLKTSCSKKMAELDELKALYADLEVSVSKWTARAKKALDAGKEDLAKEAIAEKIRVAKEKDSTAELIASAEATIDKAKAEIAELGRNIAESKQRYALLKDKAARATAEKKRREATRRDTDEKFRDFEERINKMDGFSSNRSDAKRSFEDLEMEEEIERELEKLRRGDAN